MELSCSKCKQSLPISEFNKAPTKRGYGGYCRNCCKQYRVSRHVPKRRLRLKQIPVSQVISLFKEKYGCCICHESCGCCLEFHHINPNDKSVGISHLTRHTTGIGKIAKEIEKCIIICSNCHKKLHAGIIEINNMSNHKISAQEVEEFDSNIRPWNITT